MESIPVRFHYLAKVLNCTFVTMVIVGVDRPKIQNLEENGDQLLYSVDDVPHVHTTILLGIQQIMVCASGVIAEPLIVVNVLCGKYNAMARLKIIGTSMFCCGIGTFLQTTFGLRLPVLQGPTFSFVVPMVAMTNVEQYQCPDNLSSLNSEETDGLFRERMQIVEGCMISAAAFEILLGLTGLIGLVTRFVGPLTIAPLMVCLELSAVKFCVQYISEHWISAIMISMLIFTALYIRSVLMPIPSYDRTKKCYVSKFPVFAVFPYLISILVVWSLCAIFTTTNVFNKEYHTAARTDSRASILSEAPWFRIPYPCQWGPLSFNFGVFLGMIAATLASVTESIGDYNACSRMCRVEPPPPHAVNRGILMEGVSCFVAALLGSGLSTTSYSENIGVIGITKVASRRVMQAAAAMFVFLGVFAKFGALMATIPEPLVGGILVVSLAMVGGVGLASLQTVDLKLSRNIAILGLAIFFGVMVPNLVSKVPMNSGFAAFDDLFNILCSMEMFVGGLTGFLLDLTVPGATRRQKGFRSRVDIQYGSNRTRNPYSFGKRTNKLISKIPFAKFLPFLPPSTEEGLSAEEEVPLKNTHESLPTRTVRRSSV